MLKLIALIALLAFASPALAAEKECIPPSKFEGTVRIEGDALVKFRQERAIGLPDEVDLVLMAPPYSIAFVNGCALMIGVIEVVRLPPSKDA